MRWLPIEPDILHAPAVEHAVRHDRQAFDLRLPARREAVVEQDRPRTVLLQFPVDLPDEAPPLLLVPLHRLLIEQLVDFRVAIAGIIPVRTAGVILVELRIGIVDPGAGQVEPDLEVFAVYLRKPVGGFDGFEFGVDDRSP